MGSTKQDIEAKGERTEGLAATGELRTDNSAFGRCTPLLSSHPSNLQPAGTQRLA